MGVQRIMAALADFALPSVAQAQGWRGIEGVWRIDAGVELCPAGVAWVYAFSDDGTRLLLWTQGSGIAEPVSIPARFGPRPRLQGRLPFYNTRILARSGATLRNTHERLAVDGDRLTISNGAMTCRATRVR